MGMAELRIARNAAEPPRARRAGSAHQLLSTSSRGVHPGAYPHAPQPSARGDRDALGQADIPIALPGYLRLLLSRPVGTLDLC